jgi:hypothetical protein
MNSRLPIASVALLFFISSFSSASAESGPLNAKCLLQIDDKTYMDDRCKFRSDTDSDYFSDLRILITCPDGMDASKSSCSGAEQRVTRPGVFGYLFRREQDAASLCWNMGKLRKASPCFQGLQRSGACWTNPRAQDAYQPGKTSAVKFCAWAL